MEKENLTNLAGTLNFTYNAVSATVMLKLHTHTTVTQMTHITIINLPTTVYLDKILKYTKITAALPNLMLCGILRVP